MCVCVCVCVCVCTHLQITALLGLHLIALISGSLFSLHKLLIKELKLSELEEP